jgi:hypothetical protein
MRSFLLATALLIALVAPAGAAMVGDASVPFRAQRSVTVDGRVYTGTLFHTPGHQRHDQDMFGMHEEFLLDTGAAEGDLVLPALKTYVEFPFPAMMADLASPDLLGAPVGSETIATIRTTKYRIDHRAPDGSHATGFLWESREGILMKLDVSIVRAHGGKPLTIAMALSHVEFGPQDPALFALPANYAKLPAEAIAPLLGASPH